MDHRNCVDHIHCTVKAVPIFSTQKNGIFLSFWVWVQIHYITITEFRMDLRRRSNKLLPVDPILMMFQLLSLASFPRGQGLAQHVPVPMNLQDTLRSSPPENKAMKRATFVGISTTSLFYILCGCVGYAAFGNNAPGNFLTGFGFYEPFWLIDFANICIAVHLVGAYQVKSIDQFPTPFNGEYPLSYFRLIWRTAYVIVTTVIAMIFPFFNAFLALLGATSFWPLTVYFPVEMYIARTKLPRFSFTWIWLKILSWACLVISLMAAAGSIQSLAHEVKKYKPFQVEI